MLYEDRPFRRWMLGQNCILKVLKIQNSKTPNLSSHHHSLWYARFTPYFRTCFRQPHSYKCLALWATLPRLLTIKISPESLTVRPLNSFSEINIQWLSSEVLLSLSTATFTCICISGSMLYFCISVFLGHWTQYFCISLGGCSAAVFCRYAAARLNRRLWIGRY